MRSAPIESGAIDAGRAALAAEAAPARPFDIRPQSWIKRVLPRTMFGRSLLLIVMPLVLVQMIAAWVFYARHWETVSYRFSSDVAGDIGMLIDGMKAAPAGPELTRLMETASILTDMSYALERGATLPPAAPPVGTLLETQLRQTLSERVARPFWVDTESNPSDVQIKVQLRAGVLSVTVPRKRLYTSTTYIFMLWMIGSSLVLLFVAALFLRNQVKSLRRLAAAADGFGKGRPMTYSKVEGALEVRQAAIAFFQMRDRIQRQVRQRTEMLAGVSHDLRTPLTRMKLALEMMGTDPTVADLKSDVIEMEGLIDIYLDFARGEGTETPVETDIALLLDDIAAASRRDGTALSLTAPEELLVPVRPDALRRCLGNLIGNAQRYGSHVWLTGRATEDGVDIVIDDDGPGIPAEDRERVFQPFVRLDASRNPATGGIGLGLAIARDVARTHGGDVRLETSPQGGLRARVHLPR
ncbi:MAG TPA: ATP-binding protein [Stellaceae bacterium]|jgi:two-component system osmolarity sensor histidine kinase EnvZ|nr:ATP-binding protein [Stellaceae bacterium]